MKKIILISFAFVFLCGCRSQYKANLNLNKLEVGMLKDQVLEIMGTPGHREAQGHKEWLIYQTAKGRPWIMRSRYMTPLLLENGILIGWGRNSWPPQDQK